MLRTISQVRASFWEAYPQYKRKGRTRQNGYNTDTRTAFCDHVEHLRRSGDISDKLAQRVTL